MTIIPVTVTARNEARSIEVCLRSLCWAQRQAEAVLPVRYELLVVLDDCTDETERIVRGLGVAVRTSTGGKVEAQRTGLRPGPFQIYCDADVVLAPDALCALTRAMLDDPSLQIAFPPKTPLRPRRQGPLAWALFVYNQRRGFSSQRSWFSGKLFAIRRWQVPTSDEVHARGGRCPPSRFYAPRSALRVDDIYLSARTVADGGLGALRECAADAVRFRPPETARGMYRYYRRMRRELERTERLFPELRSTLRAHGRRPPDLLRHARFSERLAFGIFTSALLLCRAAYVIERAAVDQLGLRASDPWPTIGETKLS